MKEGTILVCALVLTALIAWWSGQQPTPDASLPPPAEITPPPPRPAPPEPALAAQRAATPAPPAARADQAYRCRRGASSTFSDRPCGPGETQEIITLRAPPPGSPTASYQEQYARLVENRPVIPTARAPAHHADEADQKTVECEHWAQEIRHLDEAMRQPQSGSMMDWLASRKRVAHDRRFTLGC